MTRFAEEIEALERLPPLERSRAVKEAIERRRQEVRALALVRARAVAELRRTRGVQDLAAMLGISRKKVYELLAAAETAVTTETSQGAGAATRPPESWSS